MGQWSRHRLLTAVRVKVLWGRKQVYSSSELSRLFFLSADAAAASTMVSASAPSIYSVQALSLLAEVKMPLTCPL